MKNYTTSSPNDSHFITTSLFTDFDNTNTTTNYFTDLDYVDDDASNLTDSYYTTTTSSPTATVDLDSTSYNNLTHLDTTSRASWVIEVYWFELNSWANTIWVQYKGYS